jgi:co-chaperonin GroES (HSP10)
MLNPGLTPLLDRVLVELDESIPEVGGIYIPIATDRWIGRDGHVESYGRGRVVACGPGKRHPKTLRHQRLEFQGPTMVRPVQPGDMIRFSELEYPEHKANGMRYALITEGDIVGVEVDSQTGAELFLAARQILDAQPVPMDGRMLG